MQEQKRIFAGKAIRKTVDFHPRLYKKIRAYARKRGCQNFGEAIRDLIRLVLDTPPNTTKKGR